MESAQESPLQQPANASRSKEFVWLLNPDSQLRERIDHEDLMALVGVVLNTPKTFFQALPPGVGFDLQIACALLPGGKLLLEFQTQPADGPPPLLAELRVRLEQAPWPSVRNGPVALASRSKVWGGCPPAPSTFQMPFAVMLQGKRGMLDDLLMEAGGGGQDSEWPGGENPFAGLGN